MEKEQKTNEAEIIKKTAEILDDILNPIVKPVYTDKPYDQIPRHFFTCPRCGHEIWWTMEGWSCWNCGYWIMSTVQNA